MITPAWLHLFSVPLPLCAAAALLSVAGCGENTPVSRGTTVAPAHPDVKLASQKVGDPAAGRDVFRFETFGNEGFWTDAMRLPEGVLKAEMTPLQALQAGLLVDVDALSPAMREAMAAQLRTDLSPQNAPMLNDVATTVKLIQANAVVGIVPKDSDGDGQINLAGNDKVGVSCALCHTVTDKSVYEVPGAGSIGRRIDGPPALGLNMGRLLAVAANSRA